MILAGVVDEHRRRVGLGRAGLQVLIEEGLQHIAAELQRGVAIPFQRSQIVGIVVHLAVPPRTHHQVVVIGLAFGLQRQVAFESRPTCPPGPTDPESTWSAPAKACAATSLSKRLPLPERIVGGVLDHLLRPGQLIQTVQARVGAGRPGAPECFVVVIGSRVPPRSPASRLRRLLVGIVEIGLAKRSVVEPVVAHPAIHHRALRRGHFQRGMRIQQRHHHGEAFVGRADHADAAVRFRRVLHQPVDGVVGVGHVVGGRRIQRPAHRPRHHVVAFRFVLAAHVLEDADVAVGDEHLVALRQDGEHVRALVARRYAWRRCRECASAGSARPWRPWARRSRCTA